LARDNRRREWANATERRVSPEMLGLIGGRLEAWGERGEVAAQGPVAAGGASASPTSGFGSGPAGWGTGAAIRGEREVGIAVPPGIVETFPFGVTFV